MVAGRDGIPSNVEIHAAVSPPDPEPLIRVKVGSTHCSDGDMDK